MPTPYGSRGGMAFGTEELRVLRRALALALHPGPVSAEDIQDCHRLAESLDEATREAARLRAFLVADLARYRAALPGTAARLPHAPRGGTADRLPARARRPRRPARPARQPHRRRPPGPLPDARRTGRARPPGPSGGPQGPGGRPHRPGVPYPASGPSRGSLRGRPCLSVRRRRMIRAGVRARSRAGNPPGNPPRPLPDRCPPSPPRSPPGGPSLRRARSSLAADRPRRPPIRNSSGWPQADTGDPAPMSRSALATLDPWTMSPRSCLPSSWPCSSSV